MRVGQTAVMRFTNFNSRTTPEVNGEVSVVSGDVSQDQRSGATYYTVRITVSPEQIARLGEGKLVPGMPVEVYIQTNMRTVVSYFMRPFHDQIAKVFREK